MIKSQNLYDIVGFCPTTQHKQGKWYAGTVMSMEVMEDGKVHCKICVAKACGGVFGYARTYDYTFNGKTNKVTGPSCIVNREDLVITIREGIHHHIESRCWEMKIRDLIFPV